MKPSSALLFTLCLALGDTALAASSRDYFGPRINAAPSIATGQAPTNALDSIHRWNQIAIDASGLDHTPVAPGELRTFGEQLGPGRASRAMAIVHIAIFDSVNAVLGGYQSYSGIRKAKGPISLDAAVAQAAHDTLSFLYPSQAAKFDSFLADDLAAVHSKPQRNGGISLGRRAAMRDPRTSQRRRLANSGAAARHDVFHERSTRILAPGPDRSATDRARRPLG